MKYEDIEEGDPLFSVEKGPITLLQTIQYAGASGDFNPIHIIEERAKEVGFDKPIIPGMMMMGMMGELISDIFDVRTLKKYKISLKSPCKVGDRLIVTGSIKRKFENEEGRFAICELIVTGQTSESKLIGSILLHLG